MYTTENGYKYKMTMAKGLLGFAASAAIFVAGLVVGAIRDRISGAEETGRLKTQVESINMSVTEMRRQGYTYITRSEWRSFADRVEKQVDQINEKLDRITGIVPPPRYR